MTRSEGRPGPLAGLVEGIAAFPAEQGYAGGSIRNHLHLLGEADAWLAGEGPCGTGPTAASIERVWRQRRTRSSLPAVTPLLVYLDAVGVLGASDTVVVSEVDRWSPISVITFWLSGLGRGDSCEAMFGDGVAFTGGGHRLVR